ncbi:MAG: TonB family protein [Janthinobacterium lividum]
MRQSILLLLSGVGLLAARPAQAQTGDGGYSAPGFPMSFPHRSPPPEPKPAASEEPLLSRFWHDDKNGPQRASDFYQYMSKYLKYPDAAAKMAMVGRVFVRLNVGPNGRVNDARIVRSSTASQLVAQPTTAEAAAATAALEAETLRMFRAAHFSASKAKVDTVVVSASFQIEASK